MRKRIRKRINWTPAWTREYRGWAATFITNNQWRCDPSLTFQDLMQEAALTFCYVAASYPRVIEPANFMALFKRAMTNKMHDRSIYRRRQSAAEIILSEDVSTAYAGRIGEASNSGYLYALLNEMPEEVKLALTGLANGVAAQRKSNRKPRLRKENLSGQLARILGLPKDVDTMQYLRQLLT